MTYHCSPLLLENSHILHCSDREENGSLSAAQTGRKKCSLSRLKSLIIMLGFTIFMIAIEGKQENFNFGVGHHHILVKSELNCIFWRKILLHKKVCDFIYPVDLTLIG